jgi:hypothetical protein
MVKGRGQAVHGNLIPVFDAGLVRRLFLAMDFERRDLRAV